MLFEFFVGDFGRGLMWMLEEGDSREDKKQKYETEAIPDDAVAICRSLVKS